MSERDGTHDHRGWAKNPDAFDSLYRSTAPELVAWFTRRTGDQQTALDLTAETFAIAWRRRRTWRFVGKGPEAFLYGIANRLAQAHHRKGTTERRALEQLGVDVPNLDEAATDRVEQMLDAQVLHQRIAGDLEELAPRDRSLLELRFGEELDSHEIAERLDMTPGAVRVGYHRALKKIRRHLGDDGPAALERRPR